MVGLIYIINSVCVCGCLSVYIYMHMHHTQTFIYLNILTFAYAYKCTHAHTHTHYLFFLERLKFIKHLCRSLTPYTQSSILPGVARNLKLGLFTLDISTFWPSCRPSYKNFLFVFDGGAK
jgi:hypothetical protein